MLKSKLSFSTLILVLLLLFAAFGSYLSPYHFAELGENVFSGPSTKHPLGTDSLGRDLYARMAYGAKVSLFVGALSAVLSIMIGTLYGAFSAWVGGWVDTWMMKFLDVLLSIPTMVFLILVTIVFHSLDIWPNPHWRALAGISFSLCTVSWMGAARMVRGHVHQLKQNLYVEASQALGATSIRQLFRHVLPNALGPILVLFTFQIPYNILFESFLSFIGLGLQPPYSSWGVLASEGWRTLRVYPHLLLFPGLAIFITSVVFNLFGDSLRDLVDPTSK